MRSILILILLSSQIACAEDRKWYEMQWKTIPVMIGGISGLALQRDTLLRVIVHSEQEEFGYGPILLWRARDGDQTIQITNSLSALSKAIGVVIANSPEDPQRQMIKGAVWNYCRSIRAKILVGDVRKGVLAEIAKFDPEKAAELTRIAPDLVEHWDQGGWKLTFFILSEGGAVEKHSLRGKRDPFAINEHLTELVAAEGSMPSGRSRASKRTAPSPRSTSQGRADQMREACSQDTAPPVVIMR